MGLELAAAAVILLAMIVYVASGGADFGSGVWELVATGPRAGEQRRALRAAIAPIWEANHVWLIIVIVLSFVCFPRAFAAIMTALHIPLSVMLVGIVLRGSAFAFRSDLANGRGERPWTGVFAVSSAVTPFMLGVVAGAIASGAMRISPVTGNVETDFVSAWLSPFPMAIGLFMLSLCAYLAAVYMAAEVRDADLQSDFRIRALIAAVLAGSCALVSAIVAYFDAHSLFEGLILSRWAIPFHLATAAASIGALVMLRRRRFRLAQILAIAQTALILFGWGLSQYPHVIAPDLTLESAAPEPVLLSVLLVLGGGALLLVPAFAYLYYVFKFRNTSPS